MRRISTDDVPFIIDCLLELHAESPVYSKVKPDPIFVGDQLRALFNAGIMQGCIEDGQGIMFGFICSNWYNPQIEGHEQLLFIRKQFRGSSLAIKLVRSFENICKEAGATKLSVGSSTGISDKRVEDMYERLGYTRDGHILVKEL